MRDDIVIYGVPISPYVRKVLIVLDLKGLEYSCIPQVPFFPTDEFSALSPLGLIPVLKQGGFILPDSSAIVQYLEDIQPSPSVYPSDLQDRAQARWFEEYADAHLGRNAVFNLFFQKVVRPGLLKQEPDQALIEEALTKTLPECMAYLESALPDDGFLFGDLSIADISLTAMLLNANFADWQVDATLWPRTASYVAHVYAHPTVSKYNTLARKLRTMPYAEYQIFIDTYLAEN